jgi:hypothetical protein
MATKPILRFAAKIWDQGTHNAFTDLLRFDDRWWCTFREAEDHGPSIGAVRVITSQDGAEWQSVAVLEQQEVDLRDPKLSVTPDGRLMLVMGGCVYGSGEHGTRSPRIAFSSDGINWTAPQKVLAEDHWLWRVTWHEGVAYSVSKLGEGANPRRGFLYSSTDGLDWQWISEFFLPDDTWTASETTVHIMPDETMVALVRPDWIGTSHLPYIDWQWTQIGEKMGGPNFIRCSDGCLWAGARGRHLEGGAAMVLSRMTPSSYEPVLWLPSGGDCSYPGMVEHEGILWLSYYSSHEVKTSIYLAQIEV